MRTRKRSYPSESEGITFIIKPKIPKKSHLLGSPLDSLPDELLVCIFESLSSSASSPADLINAMFTCRRFCALASSSSVLARASVSALGVTASGFSDGAFRFLKRCADAGNMEACYILGMIQFYSFQQRVGVSLMAKAAMSSHTEAIYSLAVIKFNGSGGSRKNKDLTAGVALCARAAALGHINAMRELGHCFQDGYGVLQNTVKGRGLLLEANTREAAAALGQTGAALAESTLSMSACLRNYLHFLDPSLHEFLRRYAPQASNSPGPTSPGPSPSPSNCPSPGPSCLNRNLPATSAASILRQIAGCCSLFSDFGCDVPQVKAHTANRFMVDWFKRRELAEGLRLCSHASCGRPETRRHEFRRCSTCGKVNYCSRACQAMDWKIRHKSQCRAEVE